MKRKIVSRKERSLGWSEPSVDDLGDCNQILIELVCDDCDPDRFAEKLYAALDSEHRKMS